MPAYLPQLGVSICRFLLDDIRSVHLSCVLVQFSRSRFALLHRRMESLYSGPSSTSCPRGSNKAVFVMRQSKAPWRHNSPTSVGWSHKSNNFASATYKLVVSVGTVFFHSADEPSMHQAVIAKASVRAQRQKTNIKMVFISSLLFIFEVHLDLLHLSAKSCNLDVHY